MEDAIIEITLYTREGCGLCDEAKADLIALSRAFSLTIREIDIRSDPELESRYFDRIPVIEFGDVHLQAPLTLDGLQGALAEYRRRNGG